MLHGESLEKRNTNPSEKLPTKNSHSNAFFFIHRVISFEKKRPRRVETSEDEFSTSYLSKYNSQIMATRFIRLEGNAPVLKRMVEKI